MGNISTSANRHKYSGAKHKNKRQSAPRAFLPRLLGQTLFSALLVISAYAIEDYNFPAVNYVKSSSRIICQNIIAKSPLTSLKGERDIEAVAAMTLPVETALDYSPESDEAKLDYSNIPSPTTTPSLTQNYHFVLPVSGKVSSPFGMRIHPITNAPEMHAGIDIEASKGTSIKAAMDGTVLEATNESSYGNYIKLGHTGGLTTLYAHCSQLLVKKGQAVKQGKVIAKVGDTGDAVGPHLHFEVSKGGEAVNPMEFIGNLIQ